MFSYSSRYLLFFSFLFSFFFFSPPFVKMSILSIVLLNCRGRNLTAWHQQQLWVAGPDPTVRVPTDKRSSQDFYRLYLRLPSQSKETRI